MLVYPRDDYFIHNMLALEFLDFIRIENVYILDYEKNLEDQKEMYNLKIVVSEKYKQHFEEKLNYNPYKKNFQEDDIKAKNVDIASYNPDDGILSFKSKKFDFSRKYNQKELLDILFQNRQKNWEYDEIQERSTFSELLQSKNKPDWRKFYTASDEINKFIAIELSIKDFILKNTKRIRINPKYI